jgi:uncharacterized protein
VDQFRAEWEAWRDTRETRLRSPRGWLAITAIHWLDGTPQRFDDVPGAWSGDAASVTVGLGAGESLHTDAGTLDQGVHRLGPLDEHGVTVTFGEALAEVAERDGSAIVRPRHPDSPNLRAYGGTPCYPPDPGWVRPGRFEAYPAPQGDAVGVVVFDHDGSEHRLVAWGDDEPGLWILFRDATSGDTTYPANRQLVVEEPTSEGRVRVDFNRAINMPCAYTDFATCPVAPEANTLSFRVEAGEQLPRGVPAG